MSDVRIAQLQARIASREGKPGFTRNVAALKTELAKLQIAKASAEVNRTQTTNDSAEANTGLTADEPAA
jgi:hypothetical protein